ncbi:MAG: PQQ-dependent sugar dehydrogenase [Phycisphaerales bacterium]|nr:PQQ-dependent sugar dehydrogenase [Phycisphaerales bacterium]
MRRRILLALLLTLTVSSPGLAQVINLGVDPQGPPSHAVRAAPFGSIPSADRMSYLHHAGDGSGRVFLSTQNGQVWVFDADGNRDATPFIDLPSALPGRFRYVDIGANGLRGFAFHPDYATPGAPGYGVFYTSHSEHFQSDGPNGADYGLDPNWIINDGRPDSRNDSVVAEWRLDSNTGRIDPASYRSIFRAEQPFFDHPIGQIAFNPVAAPGDADYGNLYISFGDGGGIWSGIGDFNRNLTGQDKSNVAAAMIRIHVTPDGPQRYDVPADNPFLADSGAAPELFAYGFRHPQTMSFDTATGKLLAGEIGENNFEQIELVEAGKNYGWGVCEGTYRFRDADLPPDGTRDDNALELVPLAERETDVFTYPVAQYDHINVNPYGGDAICAGFVYHGSTIPALANQFMLGNFSNDDIFYVDADSLTNNEEPALFHELPFVDDAGRPTNLQTVLGYPRLDTRFGQDEEGEVYILNKRNGVVYKLEPAIVPPTITTQALYSASPYVGARAVGGGITVGFRFTLGPRNMVVDALGVWDDLGDGLDVAHDVGLWDETGQLVVSLQVPAAQGGVLLDSHRYAGLPDRITLTGGGTYTVAAHYPAGGDPFNDAFDPAGNGSFQQVGSGIALVLGRGVASIDLNAVAGGNALTYPTHNGEGPLARWIGGNLHIVACAIGDWNCNNLIDADDLTQLLLALSGPDTPPAPAATADAILDAFDYDGDGDIDMRDFAEFQADFDA